MSSGSSPFSRLATVPVTGSTQDDLRAALTGPEASSWPHLSALRALRQTAGRGRSGRAWVTPDDGALLVSVVLRPLVPAERLTWLPLLAGLAVRDALVPFVEGLPWELGTKWPNDVVAVPEDPAAVPAVPGWAGTRKIAGVLSELVASVVSSGSPAAQRSAPVESPAAREPAPVVILGIGVNIGQKTDDLPVAWAGSLRTLGAAGADADVAEAVLSAVGGELVRRLSQWEAVGGDVDAGDGVLGQQLRSAMTTLGQQVSVQATDGEISGLAVDVTPALVLRTRGRDIEVRAGDVTLVRVTD